MGHQSVPQARSQQLASWCGLFDGCTRLADVRPREHATAVGVVERIRLVPGESIEATITDGTARLRAIWTGPSLVNGLELGHGLRLEGTVCTESGTPMMRNPTWCLVRDPYSCADLRPTRRGTAEAPQPSRA